jgi:hypothetical protein
MTVSWAIMTVVPSRGDAEPEFAYDGARLTHHVRNRERRQRDPGDQRTRRDARAPTARGAHPRALLAGQFVLGMVSNLYAQIPTTVPGVRGNFDNRLGAAARWALLRGPPELQAHVATGLTIGLCATTLTVLSLRTRKRPWQLLAPAGLLATAGTGRSGAAFLVYHQDNLYSLLMSIGFLAALFIYGALLARSR